MMNYKLAPSVFAADLGNLKADLKKLEQCGADLLHVDVMDGHFVEKMAFGPDHIKMLKNLTSLPLDVHLMVERPERILDAVLAAGADLVTVHVESTPRILSCVEKIKKAGRQAGIVLCPATSIDVVDDMVLDQISMILQMTINPGEAGQSYHPDIEPKLSRIRRRIGDRQIDLEVDGGIDDTNVRQAADAGANVFVSGGYIFKGEIEKNLQALRGALK